MPAHKNACLVLHEIDCNLTGFDRLIVHSCDTDVLLLMIHFYEKLPSTVWIKFGTSKKPKFIPIHDIAKNMDLDMRNALLAYHAITGCDSTSAFSGHTKKSSWPVFKKHFKVLNDFGCYPHLRDEQFEKAEAFVIQTYLFKKSAFKDICNIDDLRAAMFQHVKELDKLPPSTCS